MAKEQQPIRPDNETEEFYEVMPYAAPAFRYRDDVPEYDKASDEAPGKQLAIITLIVVALLTIAMALLFMRGLQSVQTSAPSDTSGSLEL